MAGKEIQLALLQTRWLIESTDVKLPQRSTGSTVFTASSDLGQALEVYQGHGLFTYSILQKLNEKADLNKDGYIKISEIADYVEEEVISLSKKVFKRMQIPVMQIGVNFHLGQVN